jgi:hypothetical protein
MRNSTNFRLDPAVRVDRAVLDQVLNDWYRAIAQQGGIPAPGATLVVNPELRARYTAAVADLLARAVVPTGAPMAELYRVNRGRIPPWAWHRPYHRVRGIATPVPEMLRPAPGTGAIKFSVCGVAVTILPDDFDPAMRGKAETRSEWSWQAPGCQYNVVGHAKDETGLVTAVNPIAPPAITIETFYCRDVPPDALAGYGRGSTTEDVAGAAVHPWSATVAFHEGQHGMDCLEFLKEEQVPRFEGRVGMTLALFRAACEKYSKAWTLYQSRAGEFSQARTDDVGAARGRRPHLIISEELRPKATTTASPEQAGRPGGSPARQPTAAPAASRVRRPSIPVRPPQSL